MTFWDQINRALSWVNGSSTDFGPQDGYRFVAESDKFLVCDPAAPTKCVGISAANATAGTAQTFTPGTSEVVATDADTIAPTAADTGKTYNCTKGSANQTVTLPAAAAGLQFTFVCGHASGEILINTATGDEIIIHTVAVAGADADTARVAPTTGTGVKNTAATNTIGDNVTLRAIDATKWVSVGMAAGIWASQ